MLGGNMDNIMLLVECINNITNNLTNLELDLSNNNLG